jgi:hypothetical protein
VATLRSSHEITCRQNASLIAGSNFFYDAFDVSRFTINNGGFMSDLTNSNPTPPPESQAKIDKTEEESKKLDTATRTNDSTIDPEKPAEDVLKGFHGG